MVRNKNKLFLLYLDSQRRRMVLRNSGGERGDKYLLYGLSYYKSCGYQVRHNLETPVRSSRAVHVMSWIINKYIGLQGGIGGDFRSILSNLKALNGSDHIISTADPVGLPLALFKEKKIVKPPVIYISIGLPERIERLRDEGVVERYSRSFGFVENFVAYGYEECQLLKNFLPKGKNNNVHFVPFGVDVEYFSPGEDKVEAETDFIAIGADPQRDFSLLFHMAKEKPQMKFEIITSTEQKNAFLDTPSNINILCDVTIEQVKERILRAAAVLLPVKENSYSGATTTLLQAMALEKPVIVSKVGAIREGYHLKDGYNCLFIAPGDRQEMRCKAEQLMNDGNLRRTLAINARRTVCSRLNWDHYLKNMLAIVNGCHEV